MNITLELAKDNLHKRRKEIRMTKLVITITFVFLMSFLYLALSVSKNMRDTTAEICGDWTLFYHDAEEQILTEAVVERCRQNTYFNGVGTAELYGCVKMDEDMIHMLTIEEWGIYMEDIYVGAVSNELVEMGKLQCIAGTFPNSKEEIALEETSLKQLEKRDSRELQIGDSITLDVQPLKGEGIEQRTYILSGVVKNYSAYWVTDGNPLINAFVFECQENRLFKETSVQMFLQSEGTIEEACRQFSKSEILYNLTCNMPRERAGRKDYMYGYLFMIYLFTFLSVGSMMAFRTQKRTEWVKQMYSIGSGKRRLVRILCKEVAELAMPAMLHGMVGSMIVIIIASAYIVAGDYRIGDTLAYWKEMLLAIFLWYGVVMTISGIVIRHMVYGCLKKNGRRKKKVAGTYWKKFRKSIEKVFPVLSCIAFFFVLYQCLWIQNQINIESHFPIYIIGTVKEGEEDILEYTVTSEDGPFQYRVKMMTMQEIEKELVDGVETIPGVEHAELYEIGVESPELPKQQYDMNVYLNWQSMYYPTNELLKEFAVQKELDIWGDSFEFEYRYGTWHKQLNNLYFAGGMIIAFLILISYLLYNKDVETRRKDREVLYAIGMSRKKIRTRQIGRFVTGLIMTVVIAHVFCLLYWLKK